ncbi:hypothetical protein Tco_0013682 [Tanacetum coccineum]
MPGGMEGGGLSGRLTRWSIILVFGTRLWRLAFQYGRVLRLMLDTRSAGAKHSSNPGKSHSFREAQLEVEIRKIYMNFKAKRSSFSWIFSLFTLDGYAPCPLLPSVSTSTTGGGSPLYETPLLVVIAFNSPFGLAMVLLGREPELEVEACSQNHFLTHPKLDELELAGAGTGDVCLSRSRALTISFNSAQHLYLGEDTSEAEESLVLTLATMAVALEERRTLELALDDA